MSKALIIAEKPSVAADLARALARAPGMTAFAKEKDYFENETHVISSAIGHLLELGMPEVDGKKIGWGFTHLPIVPPTFILKPIEKTEDRFKLLKRLMKRKDVTSLINACDAGREGELIFRYIVEAADIKKPIKRLWMQSMTQGAILDAFKRLRDDRDMLPLADAAKCRSESDWLVGINATRAFTALNSRHGGFRLTPVGRVQTPTLTILANREREIQGFVSRTFYEVIALFGVPAGRYNGRWINEAHKKDENDEHKKAERLWTLEEAQAIVDRCVGKPGKIEQVTKPTRQAPPLLYDLTSLQREASNRFGFSARRTLQIAQALYEKFKVLTYPRTDSRYLPEDYLDNVKDTLKTFASKRGKADSLPDDIADHAATALDNQWVRPNKRIFDNSKVSDHFAIIPTGVIPPKELPEAEQKLFDMVLRRFVAVFFPPAEFEVTTRITRVGADAFKSDGKILRVPGWLAVYGKAAAEEAAAAEGKDAGGGGKLLIAARDGDSADTLDVEANELQTKPPARFTEATLLGTMENAGKLVEDEELAEAMSERGLGTPATRAAIIEGLIMDKYIERDGRDFHVTAKGLTLIDQISTIGIETLSSPEMTGQWEYKLRQMEHNELDRTTFMRDIRGLTTQIVERTKAYSKAAKDKVYPEFTALMPPHGQVDFKQTEEFYECKLPGVKLRIYKTVAGRELSDQEIRTLIEKRVVGPLDGFRSKKGKDFSAALQIGEDNKVTFLFPDGNDPEAIDWENAVPLCPCPICEKAGRKGQLIYDTPDGYLCKLAASPKGDCNARLPKELCKKAITPENARLFFTDGKTALIEGMISKKGRPFKSFLVCNIGDKRLISWEFPPREPKAAAKKAKS
jgi:DNA topoisomerase III